MEKNISNIVQEFNFICKKFFLHTKFQDKSVIWLVPKEVYYNLIYKYFLHQGFKRFKPF